MSDTIKVGYEVKMPETFTGTAQEVKEWIIKSLESIKEDENNVTVLLGMVILRD